MEGFRVLVGFTVETIIDAWNYHIRHIRQRKLEALQVKWQKTPKGTLVVMSIPLYVVRSEKNPGGGRGGPYSGWRHPEGHIIQPGQGAMIMDITWPTVVENHMAEEPVRFVFWCNDGFHEWKFNLENFSGTLPFAVLD